MRSAGPAVPSACLPKGAVEGWQAVICQSTDHLSSHRLQWLARPQPPPVILPAGHEAANACRPFCDRVAGVWGRRLRKPGLVRPGELPYLAAHHLQVYRELDGAGGTSFRPLEAHEGETRQAGYVIAACGPFQPRTAHSRRYQVTQEPAEFILSRHHAPEHAEPAPEGAARSGGNQDNDCTAKQCLRPRRARTLRARRARRRRSGSPWSSSASLAASWS